MALKDCSTEDSVYRNTNGMPRRGCGSTLHLSCKPGQVANRIVSVGSAGRAEKLAQFFDKHEDSIVVDSERGFVIHTGKFGGVPISVIATGMGTANMDFVVREARAIVEGKIAIIRYGTCGSIQKDVPKASVVVSGKGSIYVSRNPDAFHDDAHPDEARYKISRPVLPDQSLSELMLAELSKAVGEKYPVHNRMNATACSFYSSQGRIDEKFHDKNHDIHMQIFTKHPEVATMEMETFHLFDLARCSHGTIAASAAVIVVANRPNGEVLEETELDELERIGGRAILGSITKYEV